MTETAAVARSMVWQSGNSRNLEHEHRDEVFEEDRSRKQTVSEQRNANWVMW